LPVRFHDVHGSADVIVQAALKQPIDGIVAVGDRPTVVAAVASERLGLPGHPPSAADIARNKRLARERLRDAGMNVPWFVSASIYDDPKALADSVTYPAVVKPVALSGSRGVMRVDDAAGFVAALYRLRALLQSADIRGERNDAHEVVLIEEFIPGREFAVEGVLNYGALHMLAVFDKPDPLDGPFFEETIYLTPSASSKSELFQIRQTVAQAARAIGLRHGPIHAECRVNATGVYVIETAARPIGGLCARALRLVKKGVGFRPHISLEQLLLRHALGEPSDEWEREPLASGVMMIPIPRRGIFRSVSGIDQARQVPFVEDVRITAKPDQLLLPLPEGASYLGFIFARAETPSEVDAALRRSHGRLQFAIDSEMRVLQSAHG
jgi:biotin carboxylase